MPRATVQPSDIEAWLGDDWRPSQVEEIVKRIQEWEQSHPDATEVEQAAAWQAIAAHADFLLDLSEVAGQHQLARELETQRRLELRSAVWVLCRFGGLSEAEAARETGMHRNTIHAWATE